MAARRGEKIELDAETAELLNYAFACYQKSDGLFDITSGILQKVWDFSSNKLPIQAEIDELLPLIGMNKLLWQKPYLNFAIAGMELDFGGIGKEYAVDRVASLLSAEGVKRGLIDLGGDMFSLGTHPDGNPWHIAIRNPHNTEEIICEVELSKGALATSGNYERCIEIDGKKYSHILNPKTGYSANGLASVTVLAQECMVAGSISTTAMLKGYDGKKWIETLGISCLWVEENRRQGGNLSPIFTMQ